MFMAFVRWMTYEMNHIIRDSHYSSLPWIVAEKSNVSLIPFLTDLCKVGYIMTKMLGIDYYRFDQLTILNERLCGKSKH